MTQDLAAPTAEYARLAKQWEDQNAAWSEWVAVLTAEIAALVAQATPGPWAVEGARHSGDLKIGPNTRLHFVGPDGDAVAAVFFDMKTGQGLPDAKLIAMAPDLARTVLEQQAEIARLTAEVETLTTCGIIEVAVRNPSVEDYMLHWETRAEKAEAALSESQALLATAFEVAAHEVHGSNLWLTIGDVADDVLALTPADAQAALDARINAAREEGRIAGLREAAEIARGMNNGETAKAIHRAILAKIKEADHD